MKRGTNPNSLMNLEKRKPFLPGQSGNPAGRPSTAKAIIQEALLEDRGHLTRVRRIVDKQIELAEAGDINAAVFLFSYGFGRPTQAVDVNVSDRIEQLKALFPTDEEMELLQQQIEAQERNNQINKSGNRINIRNHDKKY